MAASPFSTAKIGEIDAAIEEAIDAGRIPGAVLHLEAKGQAHTRAYGHRALVPEREPMTVDTVFDLASLTKVFATTPSILRLVEHGEFSLDQPVSDLLPSFTGHGKETITLRHLLTHTSGLPSGIPRAERPSTYHGMIDWICTCRPRTSPDVDVIYSDPNFILLGEIVRRHAGISLAEFARREIWSPLRMWETAYLPDARFLPRIAPTEEIDGEVLRGRVHDPTCRTAGGVCGHAGVFGTIEDAARFARMILQGGELEGVRLFSEQTVRKMTAVQTHPDIRERRGLGWDIDSNLSPSVRGRHFRTGKSFGHTGYTGPSLWIDPTRDTFLLLFTNRVHPRVQDVRLLRHEVATLAAEAARGADRPRGRDEPPPVANGIDVLVEDEFRPLEGRTIGLITNHTGRSRSGESTIDLLHAAPEVHLRALFGPEHGIRGELEQAEIPDGRDDATGLPIHSLYGDSRKPSPESLAGLDALVFDIQDIGCRFYTYISTMGLAMEAAAEHGLAFFVLDRVNPIGGDVVDGPAYVTETSFTAYHNICIQHGMTVGELARLFRAENELDLDLTVVPVAHWDRSQRYDETGLPWIDPSPNMRSLEAALLYPGIGLLEFLHLSVGRGTETPFEHVGAPYLDAGNLTRYLRRQNFPGIRFEPTRFTPDSSVFAGEACAGVRFVLTNRERFRALDTGLAIAKYLLRHHAEVCRPEKLNTLLVHPSVRLIEAQAPNDEIRTDWTDSHRAFLERRDRFLLYSRG